MHAGVPAPVPSLVMTCMHARRLLYITGTHRNSPLLGALLSQKDGAIAIATAQWAHQISQRTADSGHFLRCGAHLEPRCCSSWPNPVSYHFLAATLIPSCLRTPAKLSTGKHEFSGNIARSTP
mmetsp:Transcript_38648/g.57901  ORF Transcript_38648/g.57901 Transcript_38648/m.57901 type:complete len:123 (-) Transcript_38648:67-435(-)